MTSNRARAAKIARSAQSGLARATWRRSTMDLVAQHQDLCILRRLAPASKVSQPNT
jgi:hypothetical protein